jgi:hypothetical protein
MRVPVLDVKVIKCERISKSIEQETRKNSDFRRVLYKGKYNQLVLMNLKPSEGIST